MVKKANSRPVNFLLNIKMFTTPLNQRKPILVLKYTKNMSALHCAGVLVTLKKGNDDTEYV